MKEREADLVGVIPVKSEGSLGGLLTRYQRELWPLKKWGRSKAYELDQLVADLGSTALVDLTKQTVVDYARTLAKRLDGPGIATRLSYLRTVLQTAQDLWGLTVPLAAVTEALAVARHHKIVGRVQARTRRPQQEEIEEIIAHHAKETARSTIEPRRDRARALRAAPSRRRAARN